MNTKTQTRLTLDAVECFDFIRDEIRRQRAVVAQAPAHMVEMLSSLEGVPSSDIESRRMIWIHGRPCPFGTEEGARHSAIASLVRAGLVQCIETPSTRGPTFRLYRLADGLQP